jgi:hypothetical protein
MVLSMFPLRCPERASLADRMVELYRKKNGALTDEELIEVESELRLLHELMPDHLLTCEVCDTTKKPQSSRGSDVAP